MLSKVKNNIFGPFFFLKKQRVVLLLSTYQHAKTRNENFPFFPFYILKLVTNYLVIYFCFETSLWSFQFLLLSFEFACMAPLSVRLFLLFFVPLQGLNVLWRSDCCNFQTNTSVATSLGTHFLSQISLIFLDMLNVYRYCALYLCL